MLVFFIGKEYKIKNCVKTNYFSCRYHGIMVISRDGGVLYTEFNTALTCYLINIYMTSYVYRKRL